MKTAGRGVRLFTVEEVNELIPALDLVMERMQRCSRDLHRALEAAVRQPERPSTEVERRETVSKTSGGGAHR